MKKIAIGLTVYLVLLAAVKVDAVKQRIPISISGTAQTAAGRPKVATSNFLSAATNRLVLAVDFENNTVDIEEWNPTLSSRVDRLAAVGTQEFVYASFIVAKAFNTKSNSIAFAADLESGDGIGVDWDGDTDIDAASVALVGKFSFKPLNVLSNSTTIVTGAITRVSGTLQGVLNDSVNGSNGVDRVLQKGRIKTTGSPFLAAGE